MPGDTRTGGKAAGAAGRAVGASTRGHVLLPKSETGGRGRSTGPLKGNKDCLAFRRLYGLAHAMRRMSWRRIAVLAVIRRVGVQLP